MSTTTPTITTPTPTPTLALRCQFAKRGCKHDDELFKAAYQRVNRARGTKILRCFPHCCPTHIPRSYCGSTLEVRVDAEAPTAAGVLPDHLVVYARFRQRDADADLRVGAVVPTAHITKQLQSPATTKSPWIQSRLCGDKLDVQDAFAFEINPGRRWYYTWHSSKNTAKRATKHVLEAFVFLRQPADDTLRCVATVTSPSFTLVSFRRVTASETVRIGEELKEHKAEPQSPSATRAPTLALAALLPSTRELSIKQDVSTTIALPPRFVSSGSDPLAILFAVVARLPVGETTKLIPKWIGLAENENRHNGDHLRRRSRSAVVLNDHAQVAAHVVWWLLLDDETQSAWADHLRRGSAVLLNAPALRAAYDKWTRWLVSHVECFLAALEQPALHELATSLAQAWVAIPSPTTEAAPSHCFSWRSFVAQTREIVARVATPSIALTARLRQYSAPWTCSLERVSAASLKDKQWGKPYPTSHGSHDDAASSMRQLPVTVLFTFWQQLSCIYVDLNTHSSPSELTVVSARSSWMDQPTLPVTRFLLDNRFRQFNAMPHGESTLAPPVAGFNGDYIGSQRRDGTIEIDCFTWSTSPPGQLVAHRWRWVFRHDELQLNRLEVNLSVCAGEVTRASVGDDVMLRPIRERLALVVVWNNAYKVQLPYVKSFGATR